MPLRRVVEQLWCMGNKKRKVSVMVCDNIMSETTKIQMLFAAGHKVYEKIGMIDHITRWISARLEMGYSTAPPSK